MSETPATKAPAGWYPKQGQSGVERYWDGQAWSDQTRAVKKGALSAFRKSPDEKAATEAKKADARFNRSPQGQARLAYERGDVVFQLSMPLREQQAVIAPMIGGTTTSQEKDWTATLNDVVKEGWELINGSVVFVETGSESRDKFLASGQNVAVSGTVVGYYLFRRAVT